MCAEPLGREPAPPQVPRRELGIGGTRGYLLAIGAVGLALGVRQTLDGQWGDSLPYVSFFLASILCIAVLEFGPSLLSIIAGLLLANWFFVPPRHTLNLLAPGRPMTVCAYVLNLGVALGFGTWARRSLRRERTHSEALHRRSAALEASERRFQTLSEAAFEGILLTQGGRVIDCNEQVGELVGYKREELLGKLATDFIEPEKRELVARNMAEERPAGYQLGLLCRDGTRREVETHGRPMRSPDGQSLRVSVIRDITEQKRWEEGIRRRTEELERLMDALPAAVWIAHDRECTSITGNRAANELLRVEAGTNIAQRGPAETTVKYFRTDGVELPEAEWPLRKSASTGKPVRSVELELRFSDGRRAWLLGSAEPLFDAEGVCRGAVSTFLDETERKLAEEDLRAARDELARANDQLERRVAERTQSLEKKTSELNAFCYTLAHDFRAPLRTQEGFARILVEEYRDKLGSEGSNLAWRVLSAAQRQTQIIQDLLAHISVTRSELPLESVDLRNALEQARADLELDLRDKKVNLNDVGLAEAKVVANPSSLHVILLNLLTNAVKFVRPDSAPEVRLWTEPRGEFIRLWVQDNGIGISQEDIGRLFSMFKRLNPGAYPGTGMGLAIVKQAAERMGGHVGVESEPGHGSRFWVELKSA